jgi:predicted transcriptional regulator
MASPFSSGRRGSRPLRKSQIAPLDADHSHLNRELEELQRRELEIKRQEAEMQRQVAELPKQIEERERKHRELARIRAVMTPTAADVFNRPRDKRHTALRVNTSRRRMTRPEERSAKIQLLMLCCVLGVLLILLCKSLPH